METLGQKQRRFSISIARLVVWIYNNLPQYEVSIGDGFRSPRVFGYMGEKRGYGRSRSNHKLKLAQDLNLYIDGKYQTSTEAHRIIGEKWESMGEGHSWGGRFNDGNHYSIEHRGRR